MQAFWSCTKLYTPRPGWSESRESVPVPIESTNIADVVLPPRCDHASSLEFTLRCEYVEVDDIPVSNHSDFTPRTASTVPYCDCFDSEGPRCRLITFPSLISRSWFPALTILTVDLPLELRESPTCRLLDRLFDDANRAPICNTKLWYMCHYMYEIGCVGKGWEVMGASWLVASLEVQIHTPLGWRRAGPTKTIVFSLL